MLSSFCASKALSYHQNAQRPAHFTVACLRVVADFARAGRETVKGGAVLVQDGASSTTPTAATPLLPPQGTAGHRALPAADGARRTVDRQPQTLQTIRYRHAHGWINSYRRNVLLTDSVVVTGSVFASQFIHFKGTAANPQVSGAHGLTYWTLSVCMVLTWITALAINGVWDRKILGSGPSEYRRIIQASLYLFGFIAIISFLAMVDVARGYLAMALPLGLLGLVGGRWVWRQLLNEYRRSGSHLNSVVVVGSRSSAVLLASGLRSAPGYGYRVSGLCLPAREAETAVEGAIDGFDVVGSQDDVMLAIEQAGADTVAVSASESFGSEQVRDLAWKLEGSGVSLFLAPALTDVAGPRVHIKPVAGFPLMHVQEPLFRGPKLIIKTTLDLCVAFCALVLLSPVLFAVALAIKVSDRGPVFFRHERVGIGGRPIWVWKFRSMRVNADHEKSDVKTAAGQSTAVFFKSADDPRITRLGRFIRSTSIDELPQLFNVLAGQMAIVGPRPLVPGEGAEIGNFVERRMLVKPGITGLWQVSGRSDVSAEERIRLDFYYVENWSVASDVLIMAKTVRTVLAKSGAY